MIKNSYLIFSKIDRTWCNKHRRFTVELEWDLVETCLNRSNFQNVSRSSRDSVAEVFGNECTLNYCASAGGYVSKGDCGVITPMDRQKQHLPERVQD